MTRDGFRDATADAAIIHEWWARGDYGIALVPGSIDLFVIDIDSEAARDKFRELRGSAKPVMITNTPQGGHRQHVWWASPETPLSKGESAGGIKGLDFRHHNGYVVIRNDHDPNGNYKHYPQPETEGNPPAELITFLTQKNRRALVPEVVNNRNAADSSPGFLETVSTQASKILLQKCFGDMNKLYHHVFSEDMQQQLVKTGTGEDPYGEFTSFKYERSANKSPEGLKIYPATLKVWVHSGTLQADLGLWNEGPWSMAELFLVRTKQVADIQALLKELKEFNATNIMAGGINYEQKSGAELYRVLTDIHSIKVYQNARSTRLEFENFPAKQQADGTWTRDPGLTLEKSRLHDVLIDYINTNKLFYKLNPRTGMVTSVNITPGIYWHLINSMAHQNQRDRFDEYLNLLPPWDRTARIPTLVSDLFQIDPLECYTQLQDFAMYTVLGGAVRRTKQPGCKHDTIMVLTSPRQGMGKSTFFRKLFPPAFENRWFNDSVHLTDLADPKLTIERVGDAVLVEISDNSGRARSDLRSTKGGITRQSDRARLAYGRVTEDIERRWVCVLTSNETDTVLQPDPSGQRRWIPINVVGTKPASASPKERMDFLTKYLDDNRDQIWAEAMHRVRAGEPTYPHTDELEKLINTAGEVATEEDEITTSVRQAVDPDILPASIRLTAGEIAVLAGLGGPDTFIGGALRPKTDFFEEIIPGPTGIGMRVKPLLKDQGSLAQRDKMLVLRVQRALETLKWSKAKQVMRRPGDSVVTRFWLAPQDWWEPF